MAFSMHPRLLVPALLLGCAAGALAQTPRPADEPPVVPQVERRSVTTPAFPSRDFELGAFVGTYATENFGASAVYGLRAGYHTVAAPPERQGREHVSVLALTPGADNSCVTTARRADRAAAPRCSPLP